MAGGMHRLKYQLADMRAALAALGKHFGIFRENVHHHLPDAEKVQKSLGDITPAEAAAEWTRMCADIG